MCFEFAKPKAVGQPGRAKPRPLAEQAGQLGVAHFAAEQRIPAVVLGGHAVFLTRATLRTAEQGIHLVATELTLIAGTGERIEFRLRRKAQQTTKPTEVDRLVHRRRRGVAIVDFQPFHTCSLQLIPRRIHQHHPLPLFLKRLANLAGNPVGTHNQESRGLRFGHLQQLGDRLGGGALKHHGANDHEECEGHQQIGFRVPCVLKAQGKQCRYRRGHDAPRCDPGEHRPLAPVEL